MSRKLATVRRVSQLRPIEGADLIELAIVDGWQCVVKKGEFAAGDLGVYFEIDSFLPSTDERYAFLEPKFIKWEGKIGARIKTMKLKGQLSQGLLLPASAYPEILAVEDSDVTELLGIEKWEKPLPACLGGTARGNFPSFIPKTDQERVQNIRDLFENWGHHTFQESTKMDGSSMTVYFVAKDSRVYEQNAKPDADGNMPDELSGVCSRNLDLVETQGNQFWITARENQIIEKLRAALATPIAMKIKWSPMSENMVDGFSEVIARDALTRDVAKARKVTVYYGEAREYRIDGSEETAQPSRPDCWCETCRPITMDDMRMVLCPTCGNKRCPRATNHENACTGSNEAGQKESSWECVKARSARKPGD